MRGFYCSKYHEPRGYDSLVKVRVPHVFNVSVSVSMFREVQTGCVREQWLESVYMSVSLREVQTGCVRNRSVSLREVQIGCA